MATEKNVNYTAEQTAKVLADYQAGISTEAIATAMGKSVRSIVAKLSREGVYKKKEYVTKQGTTPIKKEALADELGKLANLSEAEIDSLSKANKTALKKIIDLITENK